MTSVKSWRWASPLRSSSFLDQSGQTVPLADFQGRKVPCVLLPKGGHAGLHGPGLRAAGRPAPPGDHCRRRHQPGPAQGQAAFDTKYGLGFPFLADTDHAVAEAYGVWVERSMYGRSYMGIERSAFLVDEDGPLEQVWYKVSPAGTVENLGGHHDLSRPATTTDVAQGPVSVGCALATWTGKPRVVGPRRFARVLVVVMGTLPVAQHRLQLGGRDRSGGQRPQ